MHRLWSNVLVVGVIALVLTTGVEAGVEVGSPAPDFCLPSSKGDKVCLNDFKGKENVVLLFYVLDFTPG